MGFINRISEGIASFPHESWMWFKSLSQQEWIALLAVVAVIGFFFVKGSKQSHV